MFKLIPLLVVCAALPGCGERMNAGLSDMGASVAGMPYYGVTPVPLVIAQPVAAPSPYMQPMPAPIPWNPPTITPLAR